MPCLEQAIDCSRCKRNKLRAFRAALQVGATVNIAGLEPDQIPQLMLFLVNSTGLGTSAVPVTTTGETQSGQAPSEAALSIVASSPFILPSQQLQQRALWLC